MAYELPDDDPFQGGSGFKEGAAVVAESYFTKPTDYNQGRTLCLMLKKVYEDGEEVIDRYSCGNDFDSFDDGETAEHPKDTDKKHPFNVNSAVQELVMKAFAAGREVDRTVPNAQYPEGRPVTDVEVLMRGRSDQMGGGGSRVAAIWKGLNFEWKNFTETKPIRDKDTGKTSEVTWSRSMPIAFLGVSEIVDVPGNEFQAPTQQVLPSAPVPAPPGPTTGPVPPAPPAPPSNEQVAQQSATESAQGEGVPASPVPPAPPAPPAQPEAAAPVQPVQEQPPMQTVEGVGGNGSGVLGMIQDPTVVAAITLNATQMDYPSWVDYAMAQPNVAAIPEVVMALADEGLYNALRGV